MGTSPSNCLSRLTGQTLALDSSFLEENSERLHCRSRANPEANHQIRDFSLKSSLQKDDGLCFKEQKLDQKLTSQEKARETESLVV